MSNPKLLSIDELIGFQVQSTADWRRDKAQQFSDDARNLEAAEELDALAAKIRSLEGSEIHIQICELTDRLDRLFESGEDCFSRLEDLNEDVSSALRDVGFRGGFSTGTELLEWYRDLLQEKLHDGLGEAAVPVPDLDEQVANDPAVKAAKQAYDEAYAKAYAEVRKKQ
jgi:hypothetical protein